MPIPKEMILRLVELARIKLNSIELDDLAFDLTKIIKYCGCLNSVDIDVNDYYMSFHRGSNVFREDVIIPSISIDKTVKNAPRTKDDYFVVPRVIE